MVGLSGRARVVARLFRPRRLALGDETIEIASRFSTALSRLALLGDDEGFATLRKQHGAALPSVLRDALDAIEAVYASGTSAVRDFPEQARRVLARIADVRASLARSGVEGDTRRLARGLVEVIEPAGPGAAR